VGEQHVDHLVMVVSARSLHRKLPELHPSHIPHTRVCCQVYRSSVHHLKGDAVAQELRAAGSVACASPQHDGADAKH
jgi:hypothetical protein